MKQRRLGLILGITLTVMAAIAAIGVAVAQLSRPAASAPNSSALKGVLRQGVPLPLIYSGKVLIQEQEAWGGLWLFACVQGCRSYQSEPVMTGPGGEYRVLVIGPPNESFLNKELTFWIVDGIRRIKATTTAIYRVLSDPRDLTPTLDLEFLDPLPIDSNGDNVLNVTDLRFVAGAFGTSPGSTPTPTPTVPPTPDINRGGAAVGSFPPSDPSADINRDGIVDIEDLAIVARFLERALWDLNLSPGMNQVSLPGDPWNTSIDAVFGDTGTVYLVFTRDGSRWLVASRANGAFEGTLETIDAGHAYWVRSAATVTVEIYIPPLGGQQILPTVSVRGGRWNLVPVISLLPVGSGRREIQWGTKLDADDYLGANWTRAFTFNQGRWISIRQGATPQCENPAAPVPANAVGTCGVETAPGSGEYFTTPTADLADGLRIGRGYWVFFTEDGTLTP